MADDSIGKSNVKDTERMMIDRAPSAETALEVIDKDSPILPVLAPRWFLAVAAAVMLITATSDTIFTKTQNKQRLPPCDGCEPKYFEAPFFQTFIGHFGQSLFIPILWLDRHIARKRQKAPMLDIPTEPADFKKPPAPLWVWIFPLLLDFVATTCLNYSTMLAQASTVQMLRTTNIVFAFLLNAFVLKNRIYIHQIGGVLLVFVGLIIAAIYALSHPDQETNYENLEWLGIVTSLVGTLGHVSQWVVEEAIFRRHYSSPFEAAGWQGVYGVVVGVVALAICENAGWENVTGGLYQMTRPVHEGRMILGFVLGYIISLMINTASGITVTKLGSSLLRAIVNACRSVSIWLVEMIIGWAVFAVLNFVGLCVITMAVVVYNYNYLISKRNFWFGDQYLRKPAGCLPNKYEVTNRGANIPDDALSLSPSYAVLERREAAH